MKKYSLFLLLAIASIWGVYAQELRCRVIINDDQVEASAKPLLKEFKNAVMQFMNSRRWTNLNYKPEERIVCNLQLTLKSTQIGLYTGIAKVQSIRPVFGTNYETIICNYNDKNFDFEYNQSQPLDYSENSVSSNLTAMLSFYAYMIIGLDQDSFTKLGGTPYYQKAQNIMTLASQQFAEASGWKAFDANNQSRYWLVENLQSPQLTLIREGLYTYHRLALDMFEKDADNARVKIVDVLNKIKTANQQKRLSVLFAIFFDAKKDELVKIFSQGNMQYRQQAQELLINLDPVNAGKYKKITES